jgi:hypothetical protein
MESVNLKQKNLDVYVHKKKRFSILWVFLSLIKYIVFVFEDVKKSFLEVLETIERKNKAQEIERMARRLEQYWIMEVIKIAKFFGWDPICGFPDKEGAVKSRKAWHQSKSYVDIRGLRKQYVICLNKKLVDEDTLEAIIDPHDCYLHHMTSGTFNPLGTAKWDNVKIKHKRNDAKRSK